MSAALAAIALAACGEESPQRAVYALAHDAEHEIRSGVCERMLASTALPAAVADAIGLPATKGRSDVVWTRRTCDRRIAEGILHGMVEEPRVADVVAADVASQDGISEVATAVLVDGAQRRRLPLVRYRGVWRVVLPPASPS